MNNKIGIKRWLAFILAGFVGQLAWAIENNYFNVYAFDCTKEYTFIPIMTIASAAAATITKRSQRNGFPDGNRPGQ